MIEQKEREIDGRKFVISQLPAMRATKLWHRLLRTLGPPVLKGLEGSTGGLDSINFAAVSNGVQMLFDNLPEDDFEKLIRELLGPCTMDGKPLMPQFDIAMAGKTLTILKLLRFALEVNFEDFQIGLAGELGAKIQEMLLSSKASSTLKKVGPAGDS